MSFSGEDRSITPANGGPHVLRLAGLLGDDDLMRHEVAAVLLAFSPPLIVNRAFVIHPSMPGSPLLRLAQYSLSMWAFTERARLPGRRLSPGLCLPRHARGKRRSCCRF